MIGGRGARQGSSGAPGPGGGQPVVTERRAVLRGAGALGISEDQHPAMPGGRRVAGLARAAPGLFVTQPARSAIREAHRTTCLIADADPNVSAGHTSWG
jgi:hypothetical protein